METTVNQRIKIIIESKKMNKNSFSVATGISPQTLHNIVDGRLNKPSFDVIEKIISTFEDINPKWLISGEGSIYAGIDKPEEIFEELSDKERSELKILFAELKGYLRGALRENPKVYNRLELMFPKFNGVTYQAA